VESGVTEQYWLLQQVEGESTRDAKCSEGALVSPLYGVFCEIQPELQLCVFVRVRTDRHVLWDQVGYQSGVSYLPVAR
jgi:hypothetical protein